MTFSGRPLFDNPLDASFYVQREEALRLEANCRDGINTLIFGARGMGKTTLLRHVLFELREEQLPAIMVDSSPVEDALGMIQLIVAQLGRPPIGGKELNPQTAGLGEVGAILDELTALRAAGKAAERRTAILIDLAPATRSVHSLFGRFRDELWQLPYTWIVAAPDKMRLDLLTPPANAFFEEVIELSPLTRAQQEELVTRRLGPDQEKTSWRLHADVESNPRRLLEIVRESVRSGEPPDRKLEARAKRDLEVSDLGRAASMLFSELDNYGPASASDEDLLRRMGWSRQRAAQVFAELEQAGFVTADYRRADNGRPRKVFVVVPPEAR
jgi:energy-coupling factor transporter ATP-binding protein EcfA2